MGYNVTTLSKFSNVPEAIRYKMLKHVACYLCRTCSSGLIYRWPTTDPWLPRSSSQPVADTFGLPSILIPDKPGQPIGFADAAHANDLCRRRSTTGYAFLLNFSVISYGSKTQSTTATSSTKLSFLLLIQLLSTLNTFVLSSWKKNTPKLVLLCSMKTTCKLSI